MLDRRRHRRPTRRAGRAQRPDHDGRREWGGRSGRGRCVGSERGRPRALLGRPPAGGGGLGPGRAGRALERGMGGLAAGQAARAVGEGQAHLGNATATEECEERRATPPPPTHFLLPRVLSRRERAPPPPPPPPHTHTHSPGPLFAPMAFGGGFNFGGEERETESLLLSALPQLAIGPALEFTASPSHAPSTPHIHTHTHTRTGAAATPGANVFGELAQEKGEGWTRATVSLFLFSSRIAPSPPPLRRPPARLRRGRHALPVRGDGAASSVRRCYGHACIWLGGARDRRPLWRGHLFVRRRARRVCRPAARHARWGGRPVWVGGRACARRHALPVWGGGGTSSNQRRARRRLCLWRRRARGLGPRRAGAGRLVWRRPARRPGRRPARARRLQLWRRGGGDLGSTTARIDRPEPLWRASHQRGTRGAVPLWRGRARRARRARGPLSVWRGGARDVGRAPVWCCAGRTAGRTVPLWRRGARRGRHARAGSLWRRARRFGRARAVPLWRARRVVRAARCQRRAAARLFSPSRGLCLWRRAAADGDGRAAGSRHHRRPAPACRAGRRPRHHGRRTGGGDHGRPRPRPRPRPHPSPAL